MSTVVGELIANIPLAEATTGLSGNETGRSGDFAVGCGMGLDTGPIDAAAIAETGGAGAAAAGVAETGSVPAGRGVNSRLGSRSLIFTTGGVSLPTAGFCEATAGIGEVLRI